MRNIPNDCYGKILEILLVLPNRHEIEQALGRVRHVGLAGVQYRDVLVHVAGDITGHAGAGVANDEYVHLHCLQRIDGVQDALAFLSRRGVDIEVEHIRAETLGRQFERCASPCAGLEEQVSHGYALERLRSCGALSGRAQEGLRPVQQIR